MGFPQSVFSGHVHGRELFASMMKGFSPFRVFYKRVFTLPLFVRLLMHFHFDFDTFVYGLNHSYDRSSGQWYRYSAWTKRSFRHYSEGLVQKGTFTGDALLGKAAKLKPLKRPVFQSNPLTQLCDPVDPPRFRGSRHFLALGILRSTELLF